MKKIWFIIIILIVLAIGWFVFLGNENSKESTSGSLATNPTLQKAPDFSLKDYEGRTVNLSDFKEKPMVINSWAAWCPFCVAEMPDFAEAQKAFGDEVAIVLINRAESLATAKKFSDEVGVTGRLILLLDPSDSFYRSIGGFSMPETIFVDKNGNIVIHKRGPMDLDEIKNKINQLVNE